MYKVFDDCTKNQLITDFETLVKDAEALLEATASHGGEELAGVRARAAQSIKAIKAKMADEQAAVLAFTKDAAKSADVYVHLYPWTAVGAAAGVGLLVGLLSSSRR